MLKPAYKELNEALSDAIRLGAEQEARGIPPLQTASAAALMIGIIIREISDHPSQAQQALATLIEVIKLTAEGVPLQQNAPLH